MIEAIREIGEYAIRKAEKNIDEPLGILIDDPSNRETKNVLFITLERRGHDFIYKGVNIEEFFGNKLAQYVYKKGPSRGLDLTPTSMVTTVESTFNKIKILPWFKNYNKVGSNENTDFLVRIGNCIRKNKKEILEDLKKHLV